MNELNGWQGVVTAETRNKQDFFEAKGVRHQELMFALVGLGVIAGICGLVFFDNFIPSIRGRADHRGAVHRGRGDDAQEQARRRAARQMRSAAPLAQEIPARLTRSSHRREGVGRNDGVRLCSRVADEAIKALRMRMPQIVEDPDFMPVYYWMMPHYYGTAWCFPR